MISSSVCMVRVSRAGGSYGGGQSTGSSCVSASSGWLSDFSPFSLRLHSGGNIFAHLSNPPSAQGLPALGGNGGFLQGLRGEGVLSVWTTTGSGEGKVGVFALETLLESWASAGEGVWCKVMSVCWVSVSGWLLGCRFILTSKGESGGRGSRRTGLSWPRGFFGSSSDLAKKGKRRLRRQRRGTSRFRRKWCENNCLI